MDIISFLRRTGMSQATLAFKLETSPANVNKWVKGDGFPSYELCVKLLRMGISTEELFDVKCTNEPPRMSDNEFRERVRAALTEIMDRK